MERYLSELNGKQMYDFVEALHFSRPAGTTEEKKAATYLYETFQESGLKPQIEEFSFADSEILKQSCRISFPVDLISDSIANPQNPSTEELEIVCAGYGYVYGEALMEAEGELIYIEAADEISLKKTEGKIALVNDIVRGALYEKLEQHGAIGFISIVGTPADRGEDTIPSLKIMKRPKGRQLPGVCIHWKDAVRLVEMEKPLKAHLYIKQRQITCNSCNVTARIQGSELPEEIITVAAHFDSVPQGPGAYDNLSAVAMLMEASRFFTKYPPKRTIEFLCFGAEEKGLKGSIAYVKKHAAELSKHQFMLNTDLAGQTIGGTVLGLTTDQAVETALKKVVQKAGIGCCFKRQVWSSDSNTFAWKGIPALTINRDGYGMHTCHDTIDYISEWALKRGAALLICLCEYLSNTKELPFERKMPEKFLKELSGYFEDFE